MALLLNKDWDRPDIVDTGLEDVICAKISNRRIGRAYHLIGVYIPHGSTSAHYKYGDLSREELWEVPELKEQENWPQMRRMLHRRRLMDPLLAGLAVFCLLYKLTPKGGWGGRYLFPSPARG